MTHRHCQHQLMLLLQLRRQQTWQRRRRSRHDILPPLHLLQVDKSMIQSSLDLLDLHRIMLFHHILPIKSSYLIMKRYKPHQTIKLNQLVWQYMHLHHLHLLHPCTWRQQNPCHLYQIEVRCNVIYSCLCPRLLSYSKLSLNNSFQQENRNWWMKGTLLFNFFNFLLASSYNLITGPIVRVNG